MPSPTFVLAGSPAAGKSTTARALARRFPRAIHLPVDDLRQMVVTGMAWPAPDWSPEIARQVTLARTAAVRMAHDYAGDGFAVVLDDFCDPLGLREYGDLVAAPGTRGVVLYPTEAEARRRNGLRGGDGAAPHADMAIGHAYGFMAPLIGGLEAAGWLVLDTTGLDVEAAVDAILASTGTPAGPG